MVVRAIANIEKEVYNELSRYAEEINNQNMAQVAGGLVAEALQGRGYLGGRHCKEGGGLCRCGADK